MDGTKDPEAKMIEKLILETRSYRRFYQGVGVETDQLKKLVDYARLGGSARNAQPLKFMILNTVKDNTRMFPYLGWAGYLSDWQGPDEGERPSAYIICLLDTTVSTEGDCDLGIATQNIMLGATEMGLGGCRIASFSPEIRNEFDIPGHLKILLVLALGKPREVVVIEELEADGDIKYWRTHDHVHHVPKRSLDEVIV